MKKIITLGVLIVAMCVLTGCESKDPGANAADQVIEFKEDARESVSEQNQDVWELEDAGKKIEEELE